VEALRTQAASVAAANDTHVRELKATAWPADVQPAVDDLVAESEKAQIYWLQASQAQTREAVIAATRTPTGSCANTSLASPAWVTAPSSSSTPSPTSSTDALDKRSAR
jgi:hypothetical protein